MADPDSAPPAQKPSEPAAPDPATPPALPSANPPAGRGSRFHDRLRLWAEPHKMPGRTGLVVLVLYLYAQWQGVFGPLVSAADAVGGPLAADMMRFFASPLAAIPLAFWVGFALWAASAWRDDGDRRFVATFTWVLLAAFAVPLSTVALFGYFIAESKIPEAVNYYEALRAERHLSQRERDTLYATLRKVAGRLPAFPIQAARDPEAVQYAREIMGAFLAAGLRLTNAEASEGTGMDLVDLASPIFRGLFVGVRDRGAPPQNALDLRDALKEAGLSAYFVNMAEATARDSGFVFVVGLK